MMYTIVVDVEIKEGTELNDVSDQVLETLQSLSKIDSVECLVLFDPINTQFEPQPKDEKESKRIKAVGKKFSEKGISL